MQTEAWERKETREWLQKARVGDEMCEVGTKPELWKSSRPDRLHALLVVNSVLLQQKAACVDEKRRPSARTGCELFKKVSSDAPF